MAGSSHTDLDGTASSTATREFLDALQRGESFTRVEACERYGFSGSTFRWAIRSFQRNGEHLEFELVEGRRGTAAKRWRLRKRS